MGMNRNVWLGLLASLTSIALAGSAFAQQPQKPNILVIMADEHRLLRSGISGAVDWAFCSDHSLNR